MKKVELLAPAGSTDALKAAIKAGADAVYLGGSQFGARAYAKNFNDKEVVDAIKLAHLYDVKVYITLNTLIYDHEFEKVMEYIDFLYHNDVDAIIIQDLGLMSAIRKHYPDLELHASTQMTIHNAEGAKFLKDQGITRIVVSRENTLEEIKEIIEQVGIDIEVFVHGALCVSYSGQCLMSSLIGGRSGNRGRCAQPCRKLYDLTLNDDLIEKNKYLISPKDLNTINKLNEIIKSGVSSLKIEGRMKSPEYVAIVVSTYRKAIDNYYDKKTLKVSQSELDDLKQIFNREFTEGYLFNTNDFINKEKNNNMGVLCGTVISSSQNKVNIKCLKSMNLHDGIYFEGMNSGLIISRMFKNGKEIKESRIGDVITLDVKEKVKTGEKVFKTKDVLLEERARGLELRKIGINAYVTLKIGNKPKIKLVDDFGNEVELEIDFIIEKSRGQSLSDEKLTTQLNKLGNSPFYFKSLEIDKDENIFVVISVLNELRRKAVDEIIKLRERKYKRNKVNKYRYINDDISVDNNQIDLAVYCHTVEQFQAALDMMVKTIYVNEEIIHKLNDRNDYYIVKNRINPHPNIESDFQGIVVSDLGTFYLANKNSKKIITNYNLNVTNSETIKLLKNNNSSIVTLSYEMNEMSYRNLLYADKSMLEIIVYGYQEAMVTKYCIFNDKCKKQCLNKHYYLVDEKKEKFLVNMDSLCHMHIFNSKNLILSDELQKLISFGYRNFRIQLTEEDYHETTRVIKAYQSALYLHEMDDLKIILEDYKAKNQFTRGYFNKDIL